MVQRRRSGRPNRHPKARWERLDGVLGEVVAAQVELGVVDGQSTNGTVGSTQKRLNWDRCDAVVGAIAGVLEVQCRGPVVGEVFGHLTGSASGPRSDVAIHGCVEGISTNNVMNMGGWESAWLSSGIKTLEGQCRAWEAKPSLD
jgi:hypothetical protein